MINYSENLILAGKIVGLHGTLGCFRIFLYVGSYEIYKKLDYFMVRISGSTNLIKKNINWLKLGKTNICFSFNEVNNRDEAYFFLNSQLYVKNIIF